MYVIGMDDEKVVKMNDKKNGTKTQRGDRANWVGSVSLESMTFFDKGQNKEYLIPYMGWETEQEVDQTHITGILSQQTPGDGAGIHDVQVMLHHLLRGNRAMVITGPNDKANAHFARALFNEAIGWQGLCAPLTHHSEPGFLYYGFSSLFEGRGIDRCYLNVDWHDIDGCLYRFFERSIVLNHPINPIPWHWMVGVVDPVLLDVNRTSAGRWSVKLLSTHERTLTSAALPSTERCASTFSEEVTP